MRRPHDSTRRWIAVLAVLLVSGPASLLVSGPIQAQSIIPGCDEDVVANPAFITEVRAQSGDEEIIITPQRGIFAEEGGEITFLVTIENRVDTDCRQGTEDYDGAKVDDLKLHIEYVYDPVNYESVNSSIKDIGCDLSENDICENQTIDLPTPTQVSDDYPKGEQLVRITVFDGTGSGNEARAGAERIIVMNAKPDLRLEPTVDEEAVEWLDPPVDDRYTRYGSQSTTFQVEIKNVGEYPLWNPNGIADEYYEHSPFDARGDGDLGADDYVPDADSFSPNSEVGPDCKGWNTEDYSNRDSIPCSYRRGETFDVPVSWELRREDSDDVIEDGIDNTRVYSGDGIGTGDKNNTIAWVHANKDDGIQHPYNISVNITGLNAFDLEWKAGTYDLTFIADEDENDLSRVPESDEDDNDEEITVDIWGDDLRIKNAGITLADSTETCPPSDPCPAGEPVEVNPTFVNVGTDEEDYNHQGMVTREFRGAVWLRIGDSEPFIPLQQGGSGDRTITENISVPSTDEAPQKLQDGGWVIGPGDGGLSEDGGPHTFIIRLDHPDNYLPSREQGPNGVVSEITERWEVESWDQCPTSLGNGDDDADNTYCQTLYFQDLSEPEINDKHVGDVSQDSNTLPEIWEGNTTRFNATVVDNAIDTVTAVFNGTGNDTSIEREMTPVEQGSTEYEVTTSFEGIGSWTYQVNASDGSHVNWSTPMEFELVELPKRIEDGTQSGDDTLNGGTTWVGDSAPTYRGTADEPANVFNLTVNVTGTGQDDAPEGKLLKVREPNGTVNTTVQMEGITVCRIDQGPLDNDEYDFGSACDPEPDHGRWTWWYVNNDEQRWQDIELGWVGRFNLTVNVTDVFGRTAELDWPVRLQDRVNSDSNQLKEPNVPASEIDFGPQELDPGERTSISALAEDVLRVERVYLDVTHAATGDSWEANLSIEREDVDATNNGTYAGSFATGADADVFDRAGTYNVVLVADDFGHNPNRTDLGSLVVNDSAKPEIDLFTTSPADQQEVGGNVTWIAEISDETAIRPPELTVTRPGSGDQTFDLTYQEDTDRWRLVPPLNATAVDVGTWEYELKVADYANHVTFQEGTIEVDQNLAPTATNWRPNVGVGADTLGYGPADATVRVDVIDPGQGVDPDSINMSVNGETVFEAGSGAAELTAIPNTCQACYRISYTPDEPFQSGQTVTATVSAADVSDPPQVSGDQTHQFKVDTTAPSATIDLDPSLSSGNLRVVGSTTDVNVTTMDTGAGPGDSVVTVERIAGASVAASQEISVDDGDASFRLEGLDSVFQGHGRYRIIVEPVDAVGNEGDTVQRIVLFDEAPPQVTLIPQLNKPRSYISANVTDVSTIRSVDVKFTADDGPQQSIRLELTNDTWSGRIVDPETQQPFPQNTTVEFFIEATDHWGNTMTTNRSSFTAGNNVPSIEITSPTRGATLTNTVEVQWDANDPETPSSALKISLWYKQAGGQPREISGAKDIDNTGSYQLDTTLLPNGDVTLQAIVFDGSTFGSDSVPVTIQNLGRVFRSPELREAQVVDGDNVLAPGQESLFTVQIDGNVRTAWANVTRDGQTVESYQLEQADGGAWQASVTAPEETGDYSVDLAALTTDGPQSTDAAYSFSVQSDAEGKSFIPEWTILSVLFAGAVALGAFGLARRWD